MNENFLTIIAVWEDAEGLLCECVCVGEGVFNHIPFTLGLKQTSEIRFLPISNNAMRIQT
jgi:hypothetical protein